MQNSAENLTSTDENQHEETKEDNVFLTEDPIPPQPVKLLTCIERATNFIDGVTDSLYYQILEGFLRMNRRKSLPGQPEPPQPPKKRSLLIEKPIDTDEHRRMIRKFKRQNRKLIKTIEERSIEYQMQAKKAIDEEEKRRNQERNRTIEQRKQQISEKLRKKEELMEQIRREVSESNRKFQSLKKVKFLYQQKEEAFKKEFVLPKIEEEKRILMKKKEEMRPMDMTIILQHQKHYQEKRINDRINRSLTSRVLHSENHYEPPKFVPKSYMILEAEEEIKKEENKIKAQETEINQFRKKEFLKMMEERQKHEIDKVKETLEKSRSKDNLSGEKDSKFKEKQKMSLNRQQAKKIGNQYMKQLVKLNLRAKTKRNISESSSELMSELSKQRPKSQYEIELIKQERVEKIQKFRMRKIDEIVNNQHFDRHFKLERLKHEDERIEMLVSGQQSNPTTNAEADEMASLYLSSIHTKLAILQVASPRKAPREGG